MAGACRGAAAPAKPHAEQQRWRRRLIAHGTGVLRAGDSGLRRRRHAMRRRACPPRALRDRSAVPRATLAHIGASDRSRLPDGARRLSATGSAGRQSRLDQAEGVGSSPFYGEGAVRRRRMVEGRAASEPLDAMPSVTRLRRAPPPGERGW